MERGGPASASPRDTLDSWKAIAAYLKREVRTVVRWEKARGMPVHRVPGGGKPGVFALKFELDAWRSSAQPHLANGARRSVAVLPFANLSSDKENEYFGDGLTDGIITVLTHIPGLHVTARTSSFAFRGQPDVRAIGVKLGVNTLLEGSVQRCGQRVRVCAQLVDTKDGFHLWSEQYDREASDLFALQDEISRAIASALEVRLAPSRPCSAANLEAYNCWLTARHYQHYENLDTVGKCRTCLEQAIALDPQFPLPYLGLAELARHAAYYGRVRPREALAEGWAAIRKAFELDDSLVEAYALSGAYRAWMDFDWEGAKADFDCALELTPGSETAHRLYATYYLVPNGRLREAEEEMQRAVDSDPLSPLAHIELGKVLLWARQTDRAVTKMQTAFELRPDYPLGIWYRGVALFFQGRVEEALAWWPPEMQKSAPGTIGMCLGLLGRHAEARAILSELDKSAGERYVSPMDRAQIYLGLGETDAAFEWLERMVEERDPHILDLPVKPIWDVLRSDPRFTALLRKMRLVR